MLLLKDHLNIIPKISIKFSPNPKVNENFYDIESKKWLIDLLYQMTKRQ